MDDKNTSNNIRINMLIPSELMNEIDKLAEKYDRNRSSQIRFILKEYIKLREDK